MAGRSWRRAPRRSSGCRSRYIRQGEINDLSVKARLDIDYGVGALNPEMIGIQLFSQT
jgi:hypothetical protein